MRSTRKFRADSSPHKLFISFFVITIIVLTSVVTPTQQANEAQADTERASAAQARWLNLPVLTELELANLGSTYAENPGNPSPPEGSLDLGVLNDAVALDLGSIQVPVVKTTPDTPGLLNFGNVGAVKSFSSAISPNMGSAATGLLTDDGALDLDAYGNTGGDLGNASLDLSALLSQLTASITTDLIDTAALQLGAVGSSASAGNLDALNQEACVFDDERDYVLTDLTLDVHSNLVQNLAGSTETLLVDGVVGPLNQAIGEQGLVTQLLGVVEEIVDTLNILPLLGTSSVGDPSVVIDFTPLNTALNEVFSVPLQSDDGILIDLETGEIKIDLGKFAVEQYGTSSSGQHWVDLSSLPANTEVLSNETISNILNGITGLINGEGENSLVSKLDRVIREAILNLSLSVRMDVVVAETCLLGACTSILRTEIGVEGSLGGFLGLPGYQEPETDLGNLKLLGSQLLGSVLQVLLSGVTDLLGDITVLIGTALRPVILGTDTSPGIITSVQQSTVGLVDTLLGALIGTSTPAPGTGALRNLLNNLTHITINRQPDKPGLVPPGPGDLGPDSFTVRALEVVLLPNLTTNGAVAVEFASSTALATPPVCLTVSKSLVEESPHSWALNAEPGDWLLRAESDVQVVTGTQTAASAGIQRIPVHPGVYTLSESATAITGGLPSNGYRNEWACIGPDGSPLPITAITTPGGYTSAELSLTDEVFAVTPGTPAENAPQIQCSVTNTLVTGDANWQKVDSSLPAQPLDGSAWSLSRTSAPLQESIPISPVDETAHSFFAAGLPVGDYRLTETTSPIGYNRLTAPITFSVSADGSITGLPSEIVNTPIDLPELPLSGGWGTSHFVIAGTLLVLGAASSILVIRKFSPRSQKK